ncbi:MAG: hypothetical protein NC418_07310 [Muribaculaceae bacterium]|nr:hypothetical protein [Muribaculaceae bacterium]
MSGNVLSLFVCVVLPIAIVLITALARINSDNKRTRIIMRAIEANKDIDTDRLIESFRKPQKSAREILYRRLLLGCIFTFAGIALVTTGVVALLTGCTFADDPVSVPIVFGGASLAVGISYLIVYFVTRSDIAPKA